MEDIICIVVVAAGLLFVPIMALASIYLIFGIVDGIKEIVEEWKRKG